MRVHIVHETQHRGFLGRKTLYAVHLSIEWTDTEETIIHHANLNDYVLVEYYLNPFLASPERRNEKQLLTVKDLLKKSHTYHASTPGDAVAYENLLRGALQTLKNHMEYNATVDRRQRTFEL